ncbi:trans-sulfuration enzyme family protein [Maricaulis sp. CAU 1757]
MAQDTRTRAVRAGLNRDPAHQAVIAPISLSTAYRRTTPSVSGQFDYVRTDHPGRALLAESIADLDGGIGAIITASGMAAIDLILNDLPAGARILCSHDAYGGTRRLLDARAAGARYEIGYVDTADPGAVAAALTRPAALVLAETPSNPRLRVTDIAVLAEQCRSAGAVLAVDNTALSPALQRPLELGADIVVQSVTKLINGHSDMLGGAVSVRDPARLERLQWWANCTGVGAAPFDCFLALRGLRTLPLRARTQSASAQIIAEWLAAHPMVATVDYPGLVDHPGHLVAARQQDGFGPLVSFELKSRSVEAVLARLELFTLAQSLGGVESLVSIPALMTHAAMTPLARREAGISDALVRLSVGLEAPEDLIADLDRALQAALGPEDAPSQSGAERTRATASAQPARRRARSAAG